MDSAKVMNHEVMCIITFEMSLVNERWFTDIGTYRIQSVSIIGWFGVFSGSKDLHKASTAPWCSGVIASKFLHDESFQEHVVVFLCVSCVSIVKRHTLGSSTSTFSILKLQSVTVNRVDREETSRLRYWES